MPDDFPYDVFLSHSAKDKAVVRDIAERCGRASPRPLCTLQPGAS
jgi:hypothetical protein